MFKVSLLVDFEHWTLESLRLQTLSSLVVFLDGCFLFDSSNCRFLTRVFLNYLIAMRFMRSFVSFFNDVFVLFNFFFSHLISFQASPLASGAAGLFSLVTLIRKRSASFTDSAFGNTSATSGSKRTTPPKLLRPRPSFLTRKLLKSYSGRSSSSMSVSIFFICFSFTSCGFSGANQPNYVISFRVRDNQ
jgi:hypothetical protein